MECKYKEYKLKLDEDVPKLQEEIEELRKLNDLIKENPHYNLLAGKTQLMGKEKTENARSRKKHSDNIVLQAKRFIKLLYETVVDDEIKDSDIYHLNLERDLLYAQIVALAHDLGHTPFGHLGERVINHKFQKMNIPEEHLNRILQSKKEMYGEEYEMQQGHIQGKTKRISFEHNEQSAKLFFEFCKQSKIDTNKVDLQRIISAILAHSTSRVKQEYIPKDIVAQIIRQVDKLEEYTTNDFDEIKDLINLETIEDKSLREFLKLSKSEKVKIFLQNLLQETLEKGYINDEMDVLENNRKMKKIHFKNIFMMDSDGKKGLLTGENEERISLMLEKIIDYYMQNPQEVPDITFYESKPIEDDIQSQSLSLNVTDLNDSVPEEKVINYICSMDNEKVERTYYRLVKERLLEGKGNGIEPITPDEIEEKKHEAFEKEINLIKLQELEEGVDHSREECETTLVQEIQYRKDNILTENARQRMEEVRKRHQEENQKDIELCNWLSQYDDIQNGLRDKARAKRHLEKVEKLHKKTEEQYPADR